MFANRWDLLDTLTFNRVKTTTGFKNTPSLIPSLELTDTLVLFSLSEGSSAWLADITQVQLQVRLHVLRAFCHTSGLLSVQRLLVRARPRASV